MSKAKKVISLSISEDLLKEIDGLVQVCHNHGFMVNRSDLIGTFLHVCMGNYVETKEYMGKARTVADIQKLCSVYYKKHDLALRREDGVED